MQNNLKEYFKLNVFEGLAEEKNCFYQLFSIPERRRGSQEDDHKIY